MSLYILTFGKGMAICPFCFSGKFQTCYNATFVYSRITASDMSHGFLTRPGIDISCAIRSLIYSDIDMPYSSDCVSIHSRISSFSRSLMVWDFLSSVGRPTRIVGLCMIYIHHFHNFLAACVWIFIYFGTRETDNHISMFNEFTIS